MVWMLWLGMLLQQAIPVTPALDELVQKLVANGQRYEAALPSLSCDEAITSQSIKKGIVKDEVRVEATMRVLRTGNADHPFHEQHVFKTRNGIVLPENKGINIPYFVTGGFANGLGFSSMERMRCMQISMTAESPDTLRLEMQRKEDVEGLPGCAAVPPGTTRLVRVDRESGHVTHLERTVPVDVARKFREVPFAALDYAPQQLGEETFWLPVRGAMHDERDEYRMQIVYSGCKRYTGSVRIVGDMEKVPEGTQPQ